MAKKNLSVSGSYHLVHKLEMGSPTIVPNKTGMIWIENYGTG